MSRWTALLFVLLVAPPSTAQTTPERKAGVLTVWPTGMGVGEPLGAVEKKLATAGEDALIAILRRDPALTSPVGYSVRLHRSDGRTIAAHAAGLPFDYGLTNYVWYYGWEDHDGSARTIELNGGRFTFTVLVNGTGEGADINEPLAADGGPPFIRGYRATGTFRGHTVYDGECVFITRSGQPPLIPVTQERYLREQIARLRRDSVRHAEQQQTNDGPRTMSEAYAQYEREKPEREARMREVYATVKKTDPAGADRMWADWKKAEDASEKAMRDDAGKTDAKIAAARSEANREMQKAIEQFQSELDAMSPEERRRPALVVDLGVGQTRLAHENEAADATPLVQVNAAAYDRTLAPQVPQVVSVCLPGLEGDYARNDRTWTEQRARDAALIRDGMDWPALEALVKRP